METITDIFRTYGPEYIECYGDAMPKDHHKVINAIINCRTQCHGIAVYECEQCGQLHRVFRSCGNRHCTACQNHKVRQWLEKHKFFCRAPQSQPTLCPLPSIPPDFANSEIVL